jgi:hypothetical protein
VFGVDLGRYGASGAHLSDAMGDPPVTEALPVGSFAWCVSPSADR